MRALFLSLLLAGAARAQEPLYVSPDPRSSQPAFIEAVGEYAYFLTEAVPDPSLAAGTWRTDGTPDGSQYINGTGWYGRSIQADDGTVYFVGNTSLPNGVAGPTDLFRLDGTTPVRLTEFEAGSTIGPRLAIAGGRVFASAFTGVSQGLRDSELYTYTPADGSVTRYDLNPSLSGADVRSSTPFAFTVAGDAMYFLADSTAGESGPTTRDLWRASPGRGPEKVAPQPGTDRPFELAALGETVFAAGNDGLYVFDGNALAPIGDFSVARELTPFGGYIYFRGNAATDSPDTGEELWRTDGTTAELVADMLPSTGIQTSSSPAGFFEHDGWLYFAARAVAPEINQFLTQLWRTDGTTTAKLPQLDLSYGPQLALDDVENEFTSYGDDLAFLCRAPGVGATVCILDTNTLRTRALDFTEVRDGLAVVGDRLVFNATSGSVGRDVHAYDPDASPVSSIPVPAAFGSDRRIRFYRGVGLEFSLAIVPGSGTATAARFDAPPGDTSGLPSDAAIACRWEVTASDGLTVDWTNARVEIAVSGQPQCFGPDPTMATLYWRPTPGQGAFSPLVTSAPGYEQARRLRFDGALGFGEYALSSSGVATASEAPVAQELRALTLAGPNPAATETRIRIDAAPGEHTTVTLYDALGRRLTVLHDGPAATVCVPLSGLAPGVYLARMDGADPVRFTVIR